MKNKKGFTLIELIAVIIILGLVILIAVPFFQGSLKTFREDYYNALETSVINSAKDFFGDNRLYLPNRYLESAKVDLNTLEVKNYLKNVKDYNGDSCDLNGSYVIAVKTSREKYDYAVCLRCSDDDYEDVGSVYCNKAWDNAYGHTEIVFDSPSRVMVYKNTSKDRLKEQVKVYPDIRRCLGVGNECEEEVKRVSAEGEEGVQAIYPVNLDSVDTSKVGIYPVHYKYDEFSALKEGEVEVYEHGAATISGKKLNTIYDTRASSNNDLSKGLKQLDYPSNYDPNNDNDWAQKLNITLNFSGVVNGRSVKVARYQWYRNGRWEDYCVPVRANSTDANNSCNKTIGNVSGSNEQFNDNIKFRFIDVDGYISAEKSFKVRIDYKAPKACTLKLTGDIRNGWYYSNTVKIEFSYKDDDTGTSPNGTTVKSGIALYGIAKKDKPTSNTPDGTQSADTTNVTWYGYTEDKAGNFTICDISFKKDSTKPTCSISGHANLACSDATSGLVNVSWSQTSGATGTALNKVLSWSDTKTVTTKGRWYLRTVDDAQWAYETSSMYCKVTYDKNGGDSVSKAYDIERETQTIDLTKRTARKGQYRNTGWATTATGAKISPSYKVPSQEDVTLYAVYEVCQNGYYTDDIGTGCTQCPEGYRDGGPAANIYGCKRKVVAGHYIASAKATTNTECAKGYYKGEHYVNYNSTSSCTICPDGYRDGTALSTKLAENTCIKAVSCGQYVGTAKGAASNCTNTQYRAAHNVAYGQTSSCSNVSAGYYKNTNSCGQTQCPSGYRDGAAASAESGCTKSVSCGQYVGTAKGAASSCTDTQYRAAHTVTYGQTSSCNNVSSGYYKNTNSCGQTQCPDGYRNGSGASAESGCKKSVSCGQYVGTAKGAASNCTSTQYRAAHSVSYGQTSSCTDVSAGYFKNSDSCGQTQCPDGYRNGSGASAQTSCQRKVAAGHYIKTGKDTTNTECGTGYYKTEHYVNYNSTSSCTICPDGYRAGTALSTKLSESSCIKSVGCGQYVGTEKGAASNCTDTQYRAAHTVNYGGKSSCNNVSAGYFKNSDSCGQTQCPDGYRAGSAASAQSGCTKSVAAGYRVKTANGAESKCDAGSYSSAHTVKYGKTSSCTNCPSGYTNAAGSTAKSTCYISCAADTYVSTADGTCGACATNYGHDAHTVYASNTSSACYAKTKDCAAGKYLKGEDEVCHTCTKNHYCPGGTYALDGADHGLKDCPSSYPNSAKGASAKSECYKTCSKCDGMWVTSTIDDRRGQQICVEGSQGIKRGASCSNSSGWGCQKGSHLHCYGRKTWDSSASTDDLAWSVTDNTHISYGGHCECRGELGTTSGKQYHGSDSCE